MVWRFPLGSGVLFPRYSLRKPSDQKIETSYLYLVVFYSQSSSITLAHDWKHLQHLLNSSAPFFRMWRLLAITNPQRLQHLRSWTPGCFLFLFLFKHEERSILYSLDEGEKERERGSLNERSFFFFCSIANTWTPPPPLPYQRCCVQKQRLNFWGDPLRSRASTWNGTHVGVRKKKERKSRTSQARI